MIEHQKWQAYSQLMRLDKPIGTLLLLWPTLWSLWFAAEGIPSIWLIVTFALGVFLMRSAGCVINDFADRKVDGAVKRTATRPLARGAVTSKEALGLFSILVTLAFILVLFLNWQTVALSFGALVLASVYPFMKRYTNLPQIVLGAAFSWAIPMAFMAVNQNVPVLAWVLFAANLIWTVAYDTMYAMVDRDDDLKIGVKSTAILFGKWDLHIIALLNITFIAMMAAVGVTFDLNLAFWCGLLAASVLLVKQQYAIRNRDRDRCFWAFLNNNYVGLAIFVGVVLGFLPF